MDNRLLRQMPLLPETEKLKSKTVAVVGIGGVGGTAAIALSRCGVGRIILLDHDVFEDTNLNRQAFSFENNLGMKKVSAAKEYLSSISSETEIITLDMFFDENNADELFSLKPDYIIDAIDTVSSKKALIKEAYRREVPIISSLGTGNRLDPSLIKKGKISDTKGTPCPLARVMRKELFKDGIEDLKVVYSSETPIKISVSDEGGRHSPASAVFVPQAAGLTLAYCVVSDLLK